jgi:hypothetical protein
MPQGICESDMVALRSNPRGKRKLIGQALIHATGANGICRPGDEIRRQGRALCPRELRPEP